ncbi:hypothetical protein B7463_g4341, partial [Scytalidium lignicola]
MDHNGAVWDTDSLRTRFSQTLSEMYREEVPLYGDLLSIINDVDNQVLRSLSPVFRNSDQLEQKPDYQLPFRHKLERHGAIRLGTASELRNIRRQFAMLGMHPVGYYDLSVVGFPLHATAFRPIERDALEKNPFRVFTTLLRHDLLSRDIRTSVETVLSKRKLFTDRLLELINKWEANGWISASETDELLSESLEIFKWHSTATVTLGQYKRLKEEHPIVADIVSFPSAHVNHLHRGR